MTLLSMKEKTTSGKPIPCEHCDTGDPAVSRCTECSVFLCNFCVTAHRRIIPFKGHQILSLAEVQKLGSKALVKPSFCVKHTGETLKLFCETCQETICRDCTIVDHREHKYNFVAEVAEKERKAVLSSLSETKAKERAVAEGLKAVQTMKQRVQSKVSEVNKEVDAFFNEQVKALEYYRANLKHEVATQGQVRINKLESQSEVLSTSLAQLKSGVDFTNKAIADGDDMKLLSLKRQLTQRLAQLNSAKVECKPCQDEYLKLQVNQTIWDMKNMATLLRYRPIDTQKCTVSMVGGEEGVIYQTLAGQKTEFLLLQRDENSEPGGHQVTARATFVAKGDEEKLGPVETLALLDKADRSYTFSYRPKSEGTVTLSVMVEGQEVRGSPFKWKTFPVLPGVQSTYPIQPQRATRRVKGGKALVKAPIVENMSSFKDGRFSWKVHLASLIEGCVLEIGVSTTNFKMYAPWGLPLCNPLCKWCWNYQAEERKPFRSDGQKASIISVENNDVFTVFLDLETKKLIIYNNRSKESEIFTEVKGDDGMVAVMSCKATFRIYGEPEAKLVVLMD